MNKNIWIKNMYVEYLNNKDKFEVSIFRDKHWRKTVELSVVTPTKTVSTRAMCMNTDEFVQETGIAIAYARYMGYEIPKCIFDSKQTIQSIPTGGLFYSPSQKKRYVKVSQKDGIRYVCTEITTGRKQIFYQNEEVELILIGHGEEGK